MGEYFFFEFDLIDSKMVVETYSDKEVAVGTCEMSPDMFNEAIKVTKEAIALPTNAEAAMKIKSYFDEKYGGNWMAIVGEGYGLFFAHKAKTLHISSLGKLNPLSSSKQTKGEDWPKKSSNNKLSNFYLYI